ncbi:MAG: hypothetical protein M1837_000084 [Sclerophora amabilis]|nr:MAG: hypothetical protein M1837_000084 [Sclerophora amabilis]
MESDPDLSHTISLHPHPFHLHPHRSGLSKPPSPANSLPRPKAGTTTALETSNAKTSDLDPVSRNIGPSTKSTAIDLEDQRKASYTAENDPLSLSARLRSASEIDLIRPNISRKRDSCTSTLVSSDKRQTKKLQGFYESQNENIERLLKPVDEHRREAKQEHGDNLLKFKIAVSGSFIANIILAGLQLYGAIASGSLSLFTTMADAIFDPLSNVTLILCNRAVNRVDPRRFPSGKARIETAGNIVFCFLMCAVSFILIVLSARVLAEGSETDTRSFHLPSVIAVTIAFIVKFGLFLYCWALRNSYSQIRILWEDHRNDLFINGFGILTSVGGSKLKWWIDPMGAIVLSCLIASLWLRTAYSEFLLLIGVTADTKMLQLITYMSMTHSPMISQIDTVRAYHSGPRMIVEVDIVMDPNETLKATHDVAEELQTKLESLPDVERAYVHCDWETSHAPSLTMKPKEHFLKKEL